MIERSGFTLVELIVVIAVLGILATLALINMNRFQLEGGDAKRAANVSAISAALEKFYDANGEYPSCAAITADATTVVSATLKNIDKVQLLTPGAPSIETNSLRCGQTLTITGADFFEFQGDGTANCTGAIACKNYKIKYRKDGDSLILTLNSRR